KAIAFCDAEEKAYLKDIQKLIAKQIPVIDEHDYPLMDHHVVKAKPNNQRPQRSGGGNRFASSRNDNKGNSAAGNFRSARKPGFAARRPQRGN
ncbi:MAG TPA: ATP-dependent helicase, partial [Cyclobacteriaceae bacterium]|nr:ATP-dependent helicase [Cyclobacteriaceae bacterium]